MSMLSDIHTSHPSVTRHQLVQLAPEEMHRRINAVRENAALQDINTILVSDNANKFYLTGRIFDGYIYLGPDGTTAFLTRRCSHLEGNNVISIHKPEEILQKLNELGIAAPDKLGLECSQSSYATVTRLAAALSCSEFGNADVALMRARAIKTPYEIDLIAQCGDKHDRVYSRIPHLYREGMTDVELQIEIERITRLEGGMGIMRVTGQDMEINMGSILAGDNADAPSPYDFALGGEGLSPALPVGANGTVLRPGMTVMIDTNGDFNGYMTDMTRTFAVDEIPQQARDVHQLSIDICRRIEQLASPGVECSALYNEALEMVKAAGMLDHFMGHRLHAGFIGHGVGIAINELPVLSPRSKDVLQPGNVIAIEPKFVLPHIGAVGIENTYCVTEIGSLLRLTNAPEQIISLID